MATLQKFKLLATQCAVAGSPTRSPSASPVIHLRRRKTLRMLLNRPERRLPRREPSSEVREINDNDDDGDDDPPEKSKNARVRRKLKDLFVSSPPLEDRGSDKRGEREEEEEEERELLPVTASVAGGAGGFMSGRRGTGSLRPVTAGFRYRLLRRAWRPVLVSIPE